MKIIRKERQILVQKMPHTRREKTAIKAGFKKGKDLFGQQEAC